MNSDYGGYGNYFNNETGAKWQMETRKNKDGHKNEDQRRGKKARAWNDAEVHTSFPFAFGYADDCDSVVAEEKSASSCGNANVGCHGCEDDKVNNRVGSTCTTGNEDEFEADYDSDEEKKLDDHRSDNDGHDDHESEADYDDGDEFEADYDSDEDTKDDDHRSDDNCEDGKCSAMSVSTAFLRFSDDESEDGNEFEADDDSDDEDEFKADYDSDEDMIINDHRSDDKCVDSFISAPTRFLRFSDSESEDGTGFEANNDSDDEGEFELNKRFSNNESEDGTEFEADPFISAPTKFLRLSDNESDIESDDGSKFEAIDHADQLNAINKPMSSREATSIWKYNNGNGHIKFVKKSKRGQSGIRYMKYNKGSTPNECLKLGATRQDLTWDILKGNAVMVRENVVADDLL